MAQYEVRPVNGPVDCVVGVPGSKSITNRALLMAALSSGECRLDGVLFSDDSRHFLECLKSLGFMVDINEDEKCVILTDLIDRKAFGNIVRDIQIPPPCKIVEGVTFVDHRAIQIYGIPLNQILIFRSPGIGNRLQRD